MTPIDDERDVMAAITYAEAGEWETARRYGPRPGTGRAAAWLERQLVAAALAEGGLPDDALRLAGLRPATALQRARAQTTDDLAVLLGARGVRMFSGVLSPAALAARR